MIQKNARGFTLIEIMMALAVLGMIMAAVIPLVMRRAKTANIKATELSIKNVKQSIDMFRSDTGTYPKKLEDLVKRPADEEIAANWYQQMDKVPKDAWDNKFVYKLTEDGDRPYELFSYGPDGKKSSKKDRIDAWKEKK